MTTQFISFAFGAPSGGQTLHARDFGKRLKPWTVADAEDWHGQKLDTNTVWNESWFGRGFDIDGTKFQIGPGVRDDCEQARLSLSFWDLDNSDHTTGGNFGDDWPAHHIEDGCAWTREGLAAISDDGTIDLDPLCKAATDALSAIGDHLGD